jgi:hypothetical protein
MPKTLRIGLANKMRGMLKTLNENKEKEDRMDYEIEIAPSCMNDSSVSEEYHTNEFGFSSGTETKTHLESKEVNNSDDCSEQDLGNLLTQIKQDPIDQQTLQSKQSSKSAYNSHEITKKETLQKLNNSVSNQKPPLPIRISELILCTAVLTAIVLTFTNYLVVVNYYDNIKRFNNETARVYTISNTLLKVTNYMQYKSL